MTDRHQFRADWHEYNEGVYFVTICCADKVHYFGEITDGVMNLSEIGAIAESCILSIPKHLPDVEIWSHVIMPNHIHMIVAVGTRHGASASGSPENKGASASGASSNIGCLKARRHDAPESQDFHHNSRLAVTMSQFKSSVSRISKTANLKFKWQERFYETIIRNQRAYDNIVAYIESNVENWTGDCFND